MTLSSAVLLVRRPTLQMGTMVFMASMRPAAQKSGASIGEDSTSFVRNGTPDVGQLTVFGLSSREVETVDGD